MKKLIFVLIVFFGVGCTAKYVRETTSEVVATTPARIARGDYLVNQLTACGACHTQRASGQLDDGESSTGFLAGGNLFEEPALGVSIGIPNITPDAETGIGSWTDDQLIRGIRDGVKPDGSFMLPFMPYGAYQHMSDEDVRAVVAYLRSVPKVKQTQPRPENRVPFTVNFAMGTGMMFHTPAKNVAAPPPGDAVKRGEYVMHMGHCDGCHSLGGMGPRESDSGRYMAGSDNAFASPHGKAWAPNLTPDPETGIGKYSDAQFKQVLTSGKRFDGKLLISPMSLFIPHLSGMTDEDMTALVAYFRSLKPVKNKVPERELTPAGKKLAGEP